MGLNDQPNITEKNGTENSTKELVGLGGWLWLVGLGVILDPFYSFSSIFLYFKQMTPETIVYVTKVGSEGYHFLWKPIIMAEVICNVSLFAGSIWLIYLFFWKKKLFPIIYILLMVGAALFIFFDVLAIKIVLPNEPMFDEDTVKSFSQLAFKSIVWIPYMLLSERVKNTFVN